MNLRTPFPAHQISYLPKPVKKEDQDKGRCEKGSKYSADGHHCSGWHSKSVHLAYVGHAALTDRLLDVDPGWTWEPLAMSAHGLPVMDDLGGMWIRLTVCGVTRLGYGHASNKQGGDAIKEIIGDALRNAAMRFGAALELWHKGDLHLDAADDSNPPDIIDHLLAIEGSGSSEQLATFYKDALAACDGNQMLQAKVIAAKKARIDKAKQEQKNA